ncbi:uncharacterized protein LOC119988234 isoform X2 [Tripterygium wilfordii]|uniref:uncharacterized protein LOC119988234 isoform X2 n=1 Tax=Tripterygium wilfordii TaxID=458696 RepID=UPI0018F8021A|nr:uncharacterized protein LOC119988234 isoform X2 [Tripterygium wilfordii]
MEDEEQLSNYKADMGDGLTLNRDGIESKSFRSLLSWVCLDHSSLWKSGLSWSVFFVLGIGVPLVSHFVFLCSTCDSEHQRPYDAVVQLSLSSLAIVSFLCLSAWARKFGVRRFLFLDKLSDESDRVREGYQRHLQLASWLYRTSIYILVCILYQLICHLQILKLEDFAQVFQQETEVCSILQQHLMIRRSLKVISHRFRKFILSSLIFVTASQLMCLLITIRSSANNNIFEAGELALCSISLVLGLFICLRSSTKISHKAQSITSLAATWHVCATINSFDEPDGETPTTQITSGQVYPVNIDCELDDEEDDADDDSDNSKLVPVFAHTISFQKRHALVMYLENNRAGITVFGFMLDRTGLHAVFGVELALLLWLLNKTIVSWT